MNYDYGVPFLQITLTTGNISLIRKDEIKSMYQYTDNGKIITKVFHDDTTTYQGTLEEMLKNSKTIYI